MQKIFFLFAFLFASLVAVGQTTVTADGWLRIASYNSAADGDGVINLIDNDAGDSLSLYVALSRTSLNNKKRTIYLRGESFYSPNVFTNLRFVQKTVNDPIFIDVFIDVSGSSSVDIDIEDADFAGNLSPSNFTTATVAADYKEIEYDVSGLQFETFVFAPITRGQPGSGVGDADADPTNELQNLSLSNDTLYLSGGNFVILPAPATGNFVDLTSNQSIDGEKTFIGSVEFSNPPRYGGTVADFNNPDMFVTKEYVDANTGNPQNLETKDLVLPETRTITSGYFTESWVKNAGAGEGFEKKLELNYNGFSAVENLNLNHFSFAGGTQQGYGIGKSQIFEGENSKSTVIKNNNSFSYTGYKIPSGGAFSTSLRNEAILNISFSNINFALYEKTGFNQPIYSGGFGVKPGGLFFRTKNNNRKTGSLLTVVDVPENIGTATNATNRTIEYTPYSLPVTVGNSGSVLKSNGVDYVSLQLKAEEIDWTTVASGTRLQPDNAAAFTALGAGEVWVANGNGTPDKGAVFVTYNPGTTQ